MQSKIKTILPDGNFTTQHGTFYSFKYTFEDGETITANHKSETSPFNQGDEVEYQVTKEDQYGKKGKLNKPGEAFTAKPFNGKSKPANNRSFALSYSKDLAVAVIRAGKSVSDDDILETADKFLTWLEDEKKTPVSNTPSVVENFKEEAVKEIADLPF